MKKIYKYTVKQLCDEYCPPAIPDGAIFIYGDVQNGEPCAWFIVNPNNSRLLKRFSIYGTGQEIENGMQYIFSWQEPPFVWHLFCET